MPRYFFDVSDNGNVIADDEGLDFPGDATMRDEAIKTLPRMAAEELPDGPEHIFGVRVRDEAGLTVFEARLELSTHWFRPPRG